MARGPFGIDEMMESVWKRITWQRVGTNALHFRSLEDESSFLLAYALLYIIAAYGIGLIIVHYPLPILGATKFNQDVSYTVVFKILLLLIIPAWIYFFRWNYDFKDLLFGWRLSFKNALYLMIAFALGVLLNASHLKWINEARPSFDDANTRLALGIMMPLFTAGIPEELFFRGLLQTRLEKRWNRFSAIVISTLLFTAWHLPSRYLLSFGVEGDAGDISSVLVHTGGPVFIVGLIFAVHWDRYRNILLLIACHWGIDILPCLSSMFRIRF